MTQDSVSRAFAILETLPNLERGFLQHVLMQALAEPGLFQDTALADNLRLLPDVLRAIPLETAFVRRLNERPDLADWADKTLRTIAGVVSLPGGSFEGLLKLSHLSLRDSPFVANFLEQREAADFIDERFLSAFGPRRSTSPVGLDIARFPELVESRVLEVQGGGDWLLYELRATKDGNGVYLAWMCGDHSGAREILVVRSDPRTIAEYLAQRVTTRDLLTSSNDDVGFLFTSPTGGERRVRVVVVSSLPDAYLPAVGRRHSVELQPEWDDVPQSFLVNENWSPELFKELEKIYLNVFSITYFLDPGVQTSAARLTATELDGYAYGTLYKTLRHSLPANETARATRLAAASPGVLTIAASRRTAQRVAVALHVVKSETAATAYRDLHEWSKLNETAAESVPDSALEDVQRLCRLLLLDATRLLPEGYDRKQLLRAGKIVASYYRQIGKLAAPPEGVEFLTPDVGVNAITTAIGKDLEEFEDLEDEFGNEFDEED